LNIKELSTEKPYPHATVTFGYDELRDLSNGLYELVNKGTPKQRKEFLDISKKAHTLFELVKHGKITSHLLDILNENAQEDTDNEADN